MNQFFKGWKSFQPKTEYATADYVGNVVAKQEKEGWGWLIAIIVVVGVLFTVALLTTPNVNYLETIK